MAGCHACDCVVNWFKQAMRELKIEILTASAFAEFGDVITPANAKKIYPINNGTTTRFHDLAKIDVETNNGRAIVSIFRAQAFQFPILIRMLERHPLGSQAFVPLTTIPYLIVVGTDAVSAPRCFIAASGEGVNYARGTWHHPLLALEQESDFLVIDRGGAGDNCDEIALDCSYQIASI